jgi:hypothetical protein
MFRRFVYLAALVGWVAPCAFLPGPAGAQVRAAPRPGLGGKKKTADPKRVLTKARYAAVLNTPSANPYLLRIRAESGGKFSARILANTGLKPRTTSRALPRAVDWRNRWGTNWLTTPADQGATENCWAFASNALVEAMVRIEHGVWCRRSVVEIRKGCGKKVTDGGNPSEALLWVHKHGLADPDCSPYTTDDKPLASAPDRDGRTVRTPEHVRVPNDANRASAKRWLDAVGPLAAYISVYDDDFWHGTIGKAVYHKKPNAKFVGGHILLVVGYDDGARCWICKNSWGTGWADQGYGRVGYGEADIDSEPKYGLRGTNPDPWVKQRMHSGSMVESGNGSLHRNFELLATTGSKAHHWWREGSDMKWHSGKTFGADAALCPTLTATTAGRNFEAVYLTTTKRLHGWNYDQKKAKWVDWGVFGPADASGAPAHVQARIRGGNYREVVVRTADGRLNHWQRLASQPTRGWRDKGRFAANVAYSGAALVPTWNSPAGGLDCVTVLKNGTMQHWQHRPGRAVGWQAVAAFGAKVASPPCMIEGQLGAKSELTAGNYELCVAVGGRVEHWWKDNQANGAWQRAAVFGSNVRAVTSLVEGSYGFNLEVVVLRTDNQLQHYWRDGGGWHPGVVIGRI